MITEKRRIKQEKDSKKGGIRRKQGLSAYTWRSSEFINIGRNVYVRERDDD